MTNLKYIHQTIVLHSKLDFKNIEETAKMYFELLGFEVYKSSTARLDLYHGWTGGRKMDRFGEVLKDIVGLPDFMLTKGDDTTFVEVKGPGDTLSQNQLKWIENHPQFKVIIFGVDIEYIIPDKVCKLEEENLQLKKDNKYLMSENIRLERDVDKKESYIKKVFIEKLRNFIIQES